MNKKEILEKYNSEHNLITKKYCFYAFSDEQFKQGKKAFNIQDDEKIYNLFGAGVYIAQSKLNDFQKEIKELKNWRDKAIKLQESK